VGLLVIRHADAVAEGPVLGDTDRFLTAAGREQARSLGRAIQARGLRLDWVWSSPLVRAVQTAELVAAACGFAGAIEVSPRLAPGGSVRQLLDELAAQGGPGAVVGHEPMMSALAAVLCRAQLVGFRKAEACHIVGGAMIERFGG
jgi:phosphohistidine phosphatase